MRTLVDDEGENMAVRSFLLLYGGVTGSITIKQMKDHLELSGFDGLWPSWVDDPHVTDLTKAGAQLWIRHLFSLEAK